MIRNLLFKNKSSLVFIFLVGAGMTAKAQLKVGDNPTNIQKSSILELESSRQGLLLPRLADTVAINALAPPDGMIIYLNTDKSLRLRSNGVWKKIADLSDATSNWSLKGNSGTNPATEFIGTVDGQPLVIRTDNAERLRIDAAGNVGIGTNNPTAKLNVDGSVKLQNLAAGTSELDVLVLNADGSVYKRSMSSSAFENAVKAINGLQKQTLSITAAASTTTDTVAIENRSADSTIAMYLPVQNGSSATKPYGFLTYGDWQKIQSAIQTVTIGAVASGSNVNGASIIVDSTSRQIVLHPADATNPGIVTAGAQTFGGNKTFNNNATVNGTLTVNTVATNSTADSVLVITNGLVQKRQVSAAAFGNAIRNINGNRDTAQAFAFKNTGTDLSVSTNNVDSVFLNVPDAAANARGVVSTASQSFAGTKTFKDSVVANKAMLIGTTGAANSTVQVEGSIAMAIKTITSSYTAASTDNTILANTTSTAITLTLPNPGTFPGRIYTIKKIGIGGIDNQLTITPASGTIDGGSNYVIYNDWTYVTLQTDGTNWYIIKK
jgi:predicted ribosome-associated RNA-binding protein Tma20